MAAKWMLAATAAVLALGLSGCGGGGASTSVNTTSMGQELLDLKNAYDAGALNEKEYEQAREKIMDKYD
jgi:hypothetical protein